MTKTRFLVVLQVVILLAACVHAAYSYGKLPATVASHFGAGGMPNGWMSRDGLMATYLGLMAASAGMFWGVALLLGKLPAALINLPRKDYWLAEPRRESTLRALRDQMLVMGIVTSSLLVFVMSEVIIANLKPPPRLNDVLFLTVLGGYLLFVLGWCVMLITRFRRVPDEVGAMAGADEPADSRVDA